MIAISSQSSWMHQFLQKKSRASMRPFLAQGRGGGGFFFSRPGFGRFQHLVVLTGRTGRGEAIHGGAFATYGATNNLRAPTGQGDQPLSEKNNRRMKGFGGLAWVRIFISAPIFFFWGGRKNTCF